MAFSALKYRDNLAALEKVTPAELPAFLEILKESDELEIAAYYQITQERLRIIEKFQGIIDDNARERVIQEYLFAHLWLLDPSWERTTEPTELMERKVRTEFQKVFESLTPEERGARFDIKYRLTSGFHVIVELKRADRILETGTVYTQLNKYRNALKKCLQEVGQLDEAISCVCIVGKNFKDWADREGRENSAGVLRQIGARVDSYERLIESAQRAYKEYLDRQREIGHLVSLVDKINVLGRQTADIKASVSA